MCYDAAEIILPLPQQMCTALWRMKSITKCHDIIFFNQLSTLDA